MNINVFDDLIPEHLQEFYELSILGRSGDKAMHPIVNLKCKYESTAEATEYPPLSFVHLLKSSTTVSEHLPNFGLIPQLVCASNNKVLKDIVLARAFIVMPYKTNIEHYAPHIDLPFAHTVVLYYVNDADGDTVFFDRQKNIVKQVSPKKGRVIMFDGMLYHGGGVPKQGPRCVVNFDIITEELK